MQWWTWVGTSWTARRWSTYLRHTLRQHNHIAFRPQFVTGITDSILHNIANIIHLILGLEFVIVLCSVVWVPFVHSCICHIDTSNGILKYKFLRLSHMTHFISHMTSFGEVTILWLVKEGGCSNFPFSFISLADCSSLTLPCGLCLWWQKYYKRSTRYFLPYSFFVTQEKYSQFLSSIMCGRAFILIHNNTIPYLVNF
jgi:hypothetical protein